MWSQPAPLVNVLPGEQQEVFLEHALYVVVAELLADGAAMLMPHLACGLIQDLPTALPGQEPEVRIFEVERRKQFIKAAEFEKLAPVEGAGPAAAVRTGKQPRDAVVFPVT